MKSSPFRLVKAKPQTTITPEQFSHDALQEWEAAQAAYADAFRHFWCLHRLLHAPGPVRIRGTVTGALHAAKEMRDAADAMVVALDDIVSMNSRVDGA